MSFTAESNAQTLSLESIQGEWEQESFSYIPCGWYSKLKKFEYLDSAGNIGVLRLKISGDTAWLTTPKLNNIQLSAEVEQSGKTTILRLLFPKRFLKKRMHYTFFIHHLEENEMVLADLRYFDCEKDDYFAESIHYNLIEKSKHEKAKIQGNWYSVSVNCEEIAEIGDTIELQPYDTNAIEARLYTVWKFENRSFKENPIFITCHENRSSSTLNAGVLDGVFLQTDLSLRTHFKVIGDQLILEKRKPALGNELDPERFVFNYDINGQKLILIRTE